MFCKLQAIVVAFSPKENGSQGRSVDSVGRDGEDGFRFSGLKYLVLENGKLFLIPRGKTQTSKRLGPDSFSQIVRRRLLTMQRLHCWILGGVFFQKRECCF